MGAVRWAVSAAAPWHTVVVTSLWSPIAAALKLHRFGVSICSAGVAPSHCATYNDGMTNHCPGTDKISFIDSRNYPPLGSLPLAPLAAQLGPARGSALANLAPSTATATGRGHLYRYVPTVTFRNYPRFLEDIEQDAEVLLRCFWLCFARQPLLRTATSTHPSL